MPGDGSSAGPGFAGKKKSRNPGGTKGTSTFRRVRGRNRPAQPIARLRWPRPPVRTDCERLGFRQCLRPGSNPPEPASRQKAASTPGGTAVRPRIRKVGSTKRPRETGGADPSGPRPLRYSGLLFGAWGRPQGPSKSHRLGRGAPPEARPAASPDRHLAGAEPLVGPPGALQPKAGADGGGRRLARWRSRHLLRGGELLPKTGLGEPVTQSTQGAGPRGTLAFVGEPRTPPRTDRIAGLPDSQARGVDRARRGSEQGSAGRFLAPVPDLERFFGWRERPKSAFLGSPGLLLDSASRSYIALTIAGLPST